MTFVVAVATLIAFTIGLKFKVPAILAATATFAACIIAVGLYLSLSNAAIVWSTVLVIVIAQAGYFLGVTVTAFRNRNSPHR